MFAYQNLTKSIKSPKRTTKKKPKYLKHIIWPFSGSSTCKIILMLLFFFVVLLDLLPIKHFRLFWCSYHTLPLVWSYWWTLGWLYCNGRTQRGPRRGVRRMEIFDSSTEQALKCLLSFFFFFTIWMQIKAKLLGFQFFKFDEIAFLVFRWRWSIPTGKQEQV